MNAPSPGIGRSVRTAAFVTNVHDLGQGGGRPLLMTHGSGPGVSAWANWRLALPSLSRSRGVIAPDRVGFGFAERSAGIGDTVDTGVRQAVDLVDAMDQLQVDVEGNGFGGALTMAQWIPNVQLHVSGHCGHWTQIAIADRVNRPVGNFLAEADPTSMT